MLRGVCSGGTQPDGTICDDGKFCTQFDSCQKGKCAPGALSPCGPDSTCMKWSCDEPSMSCHPAPASDGASCSNNSCETGGTCSMGACNGGSSPVILFSDDFHDPSNPQGWSLGSEWQIGPAMSSPGPPISAFGQDPSYDHTGSGDNGIAGVDIGGNEVVPPPPASPVHDFYYMTSPAISAGSAGTLTLSFYRWINSDYPPFMVNRIEATTDGMTWGVVWESTKNTPLQDTPPAGQGWTYQQYDLTPYKSASTQFRFGFNIAQAGVFTIGSWNIDDVILSNNGSCN